MKKSDILGVHTLANNRKYKITDTGKKYFGGEYVSGGYNITTWLNGRWAYIDNAPTLECVSNFLKSAARLGAVDNDGYTANNLENEINKKIELIRKEYGSLANFFDAHAKTIKDKKLRGEIEKRYKN